MKYHKYTKQAYYDNKWSDKKLNGGKVESKNKRVAFFPFNL